MSKDFTTLLILFFCLGIGLYFSIGLGNTIIPNREALGVLPFLLGYAILQLPIAGLYGYLLFRLFKNFKTSPGKSFTIIVVLIIIAFITNIYGNYKYGKLFTMPFLGVNNSPLSIFEKDSLEKKLGFHLYIPGVIPDNLRPDYMRVSETYGVTFVYQEKGQPSGVFPLQITERQATTLKDVQNKIKNGEAVYKIIPLPSTSSTLWYQTENNAKQDYNRRSRTHYILFSDVRVVLEFGGPLLPSENEVIKIAESFK